MNLLVQPTFSGEKVGKKTLGTLALSLKQNKFMYFFINNIDPLVYKKLNPLIVILERENQ